MKYKLVSTESASWLELRVRDLIKAGWTPLGSVSVCPLNNYNNENRFNQAMIKEVTND